MPCSTPSDDVILVRRREARAGQVGKTGIEEHCHGWPSAGVRHAAVPSRSDRDAEERSSTRKGSASSRP